MKRRLIAVGIALVLLAIGLEVFGHLQAPRTGVAASGDTVRSIYDAPPEQLERWRKRRERLRKQPTQPGPSTFSSRYGWWNAPDSRGEMRWGTVVINDVGARGRRDLTEAPPTGALRVACYGESFTFGTEVFHEESWPAQLEEHASDGKLEVWNLAVGGWGTDQALLRFRDTREQLAPDIVLLGLLSENIGRNINRLRPAYWRSAGGPPMPKPRFLLKDGALELLPQPYGTELELFEAAVDGSLGLDLAPHEGWAPAASPSRFWNWWLDRRVDRQRAPWRQLWEERSEAYEVTVALIEAFAAEASEIDARFGVVLYPTESDVEDGWRMAVAHGALRELGVSYCDPFDTIRKESISGEPYGDTHFTAHANWRVAAEVGSWMRDLGWLPE